MGGLKSKGFPRNGGSTALTRQALEGQRRRADRGAAPFVHVIARQAHGHSKHWHYQLGDDAINVATDDARVNREGGRA